MIHAVLTGDIVNSTLLAPPLEKKAFEVHPAAIR